MDVTAVVGGGFSGIWFGRGLRFGGGFAVDVDWIVDVETVDIIGGPGADEFIWSSFGEFTCCNVDASS